MGIKNLFLMLGFSAGSIFLLAGCNRAPDAEPVKIVSVGDENLETSTKDDVKSETSTNGVITKGGLDISQTPLVRPKSIGLSYKVGLIADRWLFPPGAACDDSVTIRMDDEDHSNRNDLVLYGVSTSKGFGGYNASAGGMIHLNSPARAGGNTLIKYCRVSTGSLPVLSYDYAVIMADASCPSNSSQFTRRFDNEDGSNHNSYTGSISPNISSSSSGGYTILNFCFVPKGPAGSPNWNAQFNQYVIFTAEKLSNRGTFYTDDEDDNNNDQYNTYGSPYGDRMKAIISDGSNTTFRFGALSTGFKVDNLGDQSECHGGGGGGLDCVARDGYMQCTPLNQNTFSQAWNTLTFAYCTW